MTPSQWLNARDHVSGPGCVICGRKKWLLSSVCLKHKDEWVRATRSTEHFSTWCLEKRLAWLLALIQG